MTRSTLKSVVMTQALTLAVFVLAAAASAQTDAQKAFDAIKNMPGTWEGKTNDGNSVRVDFKVISGGSAVMSEIVGHADMISMFNLDGPSRLLMTHYCATGNSSMPRIWQRPTMATCSA
jgi:hypothetical protein